MQRQTGPLEIGIGHTYVAVATCRFQSLTHGDDELFYAIFSQRELVPTSESFRCTSLLSGERRCGDSDALRFAKVLAKA